MGKEGYAPHIDLYENVKLIFKKTVISRAYWKSLTGNNVLIKSLFLLSKNDIILSE